MALWGSGVRIPSAPPTGLTEIPNPMHQRSSSSQTSIRVFDRPPLGVRLFCFWAFMVYCAFARISLFAKLSLTPRFNGVIRIRAWAKPFQRFASRHARLSHTHHQKPVVHGQASNAHRCIPAIAQRGRRTSVACHRFGANKRPPQYQRSNSQDQQKNSEPRFHDLSLSRMPG